MPFQKWCLSYLTGFFISMYLFISFMRRRQYLATAVGAITVTAGCTGSTPQEITADPVDPDPSLTEAGLAPNPTDLPEREIDESQFTEYNSEGTTIQQIPLDVAYYWYNTRKARFVDARVIGRYEIAHVDGAISSPAPDGAGVDDPMNDVGEHERIVTYCTCPHYLSGLRAATRQNAGNAGAYALITGLRPWIENGYPIAGNDAKSPNIPDQEDYSNVDK